MASDDESSAKSLLTSVQRYHSPCKPWCPTRARPTSRNPPKSFWIAGRREVLFHKCSPWDFYERFANSESNVSLVLCNKRTEVQVMKTYKVVCKGVSLLQMQHRNIIDIYEIYCFKDQIFVISEYLDFSLEDLLLRDISLTETEIAYMISQVREMLFCV
jgi:hypothetical protein